MADDSKWYLNVVGNWSTFCAIIVASFYLGGQVNDIRRSIEEMEARQVLIDAKVTKQAEEFAPHEKDEQELKGRLDELERFVEDKHKVGTP
jgi:hypothetical protein